MEEKNSGGYYLVIFLLFIVAAILIVTAYNRSANEKKIMAEKEQYITNKIASLNNDVGEIKTIIQDIEYNTNEAKQNAIIAINKAQNNNDRITILEQEQQIISQYIPSVYCVTEYDNITEMILFKCKEYPK